MMKILPALIAATSLAPADKIRQDLQGWAIEAGVADSTLSWLYPLLGVCAICLLAYLCAAAFRYVVQPLVLKVVEKTAAKWDDYLLNPRVLRAVRRLIPRWSAIRSSSWCLPEAPVSSPFAEGERCLFSCCLHPACHHLHPLPLRYLQ